MTFHMKLKKLLKLFSFSACPYWYSASLRFLAETRACSLPLAGHKEAEIIVHNS